MPLQHNIEPCWYIEIRSFLLSFSSFWLGSGGKAMNVAHVEMYCKNGLKIVTVDKSHKEYYCIHPINSEFQFLRMRYSNETHEMGMGNKRRETWYREMCGEKERDVSFVNNSNKDTCVEFLSENHQMRAHLLFWRFQWQMVKFIMHQHQSRMWSDHEDFSLYS